MSTWVLADICGARASAPCWRWSKVARRLEHDSFRIVFGKKRGRVELAGLQIISAAPAVQHAGLHGLAAFYVGIPAQSDQNIAVRRPIDAERTIVLFKSVQKIRRLVILGLLRDLSPVGRVFKKAHARSPSGSLVAGT